MELNITEEEYYNALFISCDSDFQIHINRDARACFINVTLTLKFILSVNQVLVSLIIFLLKGYKLGKHTSICKQK